MARTWIAEEGGEELRSAAARLDDDALAMDYEINADRNKRASMGLGLGNALRRALRKNGAI
jgi:hypothetical protein